MTRRKRRNHSPTFTPLRVGFAQGQVAIAALKGDKTLAELAQQLMSLTRSPEPNHRLEDATDGSVGTGIWR